MIHGATHAPALPLGVGQLAQLRECGRDFVGGETRRGQRDIRRRIKVLWRNLRRRRKLRTMSAFGSDASGGHLLLEVDRDAVQLALHLAPDGRQEEHEGEALLHRGEVRLLCRRENAASPKVPHEADKVPHDEVPVGLARFSHTVWGRSASTRTRRRPVKRGRAAIGLISWFGESAQSQRSTHLLSILDRQGMLYESTRKCW